MSQRGGALGVSWRASPAVAPTPVRHAARPGMSLGMGREGARRAMGVVAPFRISRARWMSSRGEAWQRKPRVGTFVEGLSGGVCDVVASVQVQGSWIKRRPCSWQQAPRVSTHARSLLPGGSPFRSEWQPLPAMSTHRGSSLPLSYGRRGDQLGEFDLPGLPWQREPDVSAHIGSLLPRGLPSGSGWQPLDGERGGRIGLVSPDAGGLCPEADGGSSPPYRGANPLTSDAGGWGRRAVVSVTSGVSGRGGARPNFLQKFGIDACQSGTFC
jgi:hypothetical protein